MDTEQIMQISKEGDVTVVAFGLESITGLSGLEQISQQLRAVHHRPEAP